MGINLVTFYGSTVTPQDDALIYESALAGSGLIYGGTVTIKSANMLHVAAGHGALCGRKFTIEETDVPVILSSSGTLLGRIYIHMDLSDTGEPISFQVETGSALAPVIQQQDVNIIDGVYEINLATFDVDTASISNLVNVAPYIEADLDTEFSTTSKKALQNKVITKALGDPETIGGAASKAYSKGSLLLGKDGQLYEVTTAISQGDTITNNGNVTTTGNVITQISNLSNQILIELLSKTITGNGQTYREQTYNVSKTGYKPIGVAGWNVGNVDYIMNCVYKNGSLYAMAVRNNGATWSGSFNFNVAVIYQKNN